MEIIKGKFAEAKVFSEDLEQHARAQLQKEQKVKQVNAAFFLKLKGS